MSRGSLRTPLLEDGEEDARTDYGVLGKKVEKLGRELNVLTTLAKRLGTPRDTHALRQELGDKR